MVDRNTPEAKLLKIADLKDRITRIAEETSVFLAGPFIRPDEGEAHFDNIATTAKALRYELNRRLQTLGYTVYLGEDQRLRLGGEAHFGVLNNAAVFERHYVREHLHAVIILPSSPGSFSELGDWAPSKDICDRMLVVVDKEFEGVSSYISEGPIKFVTQNNGQVLYLDYADKAAVLSASMRFLDRIVSQNRIRGLYDGG